MLGRLDQKPFTKVLIGDKTFWNHWPNHDCGSETVQQMEEGLDMTKYAAACASMPTCFAFTSTGALKSCLNDSHHLSLL